MGIGQKLNGTLRDFILRQQMFFVATAGREGRVNLSPKGMDTLRILSDDRILWLNLSGSGNETATHVRENGRMTLMFCAFQGDALILRVYGSATVLHPRDEGWGAALAQFPALAGSRQVFDLAIDLIQTSCGSGVPVMEFKADRGAEELEPFYDKMGPDGVRDYWRRKNMTSVDGVDTGIFAPG